MKIAFIGKMGSGKSTAAQYLVDRYGFIRLAFADPVKIVTTQMLNQFQSYLHVYGLSEIDPYRPWTLADLDARKNDPIIRKMIQFVGTELGREYFGHENVWVDLLTRDAESLDRVVVDDVRFQNEAQALLDNGFTLVRIVGNTNPVPLASNHISETDLDTFEETHYTILNRTSKEDLEQSLDTLVRSISQENTRS